MTDTAQAPAAFSSRWLFSKDQIKSAPSVKDNFTAEQEQEVRKFSCTFLTEIGQNLVHPASVLAINCAKVFLHRFYMMECTDLSNKERHKEIAATCIFVACKSEECLRPLKEFIWAWNYIDFDKTKKQNPFGRYEGPDAKRKPWQIDEQSEKYQEVREGILSCERDLLHAIQYDFFVDYPHSYVFRFARFLDHAKRDKETRNLVLSTEGHERFTEFGNMIITTAHAMANDAMSSTLSIQYRASLIAAACMNLICKTQGFKLIGLEKWIKKWNEEIASDTDPKYQSIVLAKEEIEEVVNQLLDMYDALQAPAQNAEPNAAAAPPPAPPAAPAEAAADSSRQVPKAEAPASRPHAEVPWGCFGPLSLPSGACCVRGISIHLRQSWCEGSGSCCGVNGAIGALVFLRNLVSVNRVLHWIFFFHCQQLRSLNFAVFF
mmetsp:Transcript_4371/g.12852  ORF Transcript_4371/g.12852 Transcript_4371/m.12852 type:complete len:433 (+) Transcript_4371:268-1566(+)